MSFEQHVGAYWLAGVFQSEHLALLLGRGFTKAVSQQAETGAVKMACDGDCFPLDINVNFCRRQLVDLSDDMATKIDIRFYSDARDALLKAMVE